MLRKLSIDCFRNAWSFIAREGGVSSHALTGSTSVTARWRSSLGDRNTISATRCTVFGPEPTFAAHWRVRLAARVMGPNCAGTRRRYSVFLRPLGAERRSTRGAHQINRRCPTARMAPVRSLTSPRSRRMDRRRRRSCRPPWSAMTAGERSPRRVSKSSRDRERRGRRICRA